MNKPQTKYACVCEKCYKDFLSTNENNTVCPKCVQLEGFKKPRPPREKKVAKPSLEDRVRELNEYNASTGQVLSFGQYESLKQSGRI